MTKRGEIYWINEGNPVGGEIRKRRPGIILTNDAMAGRLNRLTIVPTTTKKIDKVYATEAVVTIGGRQSKAQADQITTVARQRLGDRIGALSGADMALVEAAVRTYLVL